MRKKFIITLAIVFVAGLVAGPANANLVSHWRLDGDADDSAGVNHGTIYGNPQLMSGVVDDALSFDGLSDYIALGDVDEFEFGDADFSISVWFYTNGPHGAADGVGEIIAKYNWSGNGRQWRLGQQASGNIFFYTNPTGGSSHEYLTSLTGGYQNQWVHVTAVRSGSTKLLYINGVLDTTGSTAGVVTGKTSGAYIGAVYDPHIGMRNFFNGAIDDVRIYDTALSAEEVQQLYFSGSNLAIISIGDAIAEKLEALGGIDAALEKEWLACDALEALLESRDYGDLNKGDIVKARQKIHSAIQHEQQSKKALEKSIESLEDALAALGWDPESNLVSYWKFDEGEDSTAYDSAGYNDGTLNGDPRWVSGKVGSHALDFDGDDDYVDCGNDKSLNITDEITLMAWVKMNTKADDYEKIVAKPTVGFGDPWTLYGLDFDKGADNARKVRMVASDGTIGSYALAVSTTSIQNGVWYHVAGTFDGAEVRIYLNGVYEASTPSTFSQIGSNDEPVFMGIFHKNLLVNDFNGTIDDVRIYDRALSAHEIWRLYQD